MFEEYYTENCGNLKYHVRNELKIRSINTKNINEANADGKMAFTIGHFEYESGENSYFEMYVETDEHIIYKKRCPEKDVVFKEDVQKNDDSYLQICNAKALYDSPTVDLYIIHIPKGVIIRNMNIMEAD